MVKIELRNFTLQKVEVNYMYLNMDMTIRDMANEMCDSDELLVKISGGIDLVAIDHLSCLTNYRNRYCAFSCPQSAS